MKEPVATLKELFPKQLHSRLFLVGGMVRDILLGVECQDVDLAAVAAPSELTSLGFRLVEATSAPNIYFLYRKELGKVEITRLDAPEQLTPDLERRDFRCNAIAMTLEGEIIDPLEGRQDVATKVLRLCSASSFCDDPVRIFRAFRFETDGWRLDAEAEEALYSRQWDESLRPVPVERFSQEMLKALSKDDPSRFFRRMLQFRVGEVFLPEIFSMPQVPAGPVEHHPEGDLFNHAIESLERMASMSTEVKPRFCALFHDLGKLYTPSEEHPKHHGHEDAGGRAAEKFCNRLRLPASLRRALQATCKLHGNANNWEELRDSTKIRVALAAIKGGIETFLPEQVLADCKGAMPGWNTALEVALLNARGLGISEDLFENPDFPPEKCQQIIMQRRVEEYRRRVRNVQQDG